MTEPGSTRLSSSQGSSAMTRTTGGQCSCRRTSRSTGCRSLPNWATRPASRAHARHNPRPELGRTKAPTPTPADEPGTRGQGYSGCQWCRFALRAAQAMRSGGPAFGGVHAGAYRPRLCLEATIMRTLREPLTIWKPGPPVTPWSGPSPAPRPPAPAPPRCASNSATCRPRTRSRSWPLPTSSSPSSPAGSGR